MNKKMFMQGGRVERKEAWAYCMGIYGQNLACALMMNWFMIFCTDVLYVDGIIVGLVLGIARVWDSVNDPVIGTVIDRHRFKNGEKFRPLLRATPIVIGGIRLIIHYLVTFVFIVFQYFYNMVIVLEIILYSTDIFTGFYSIERCKCQPKKYRYFFFEIKIYKVYYCWCNKN